MDGLFTPRAAAALDSRFELRSVGGVSVVVQKGEKWAAASTCVPGGVSSPAVAAAGGAASSSSAPPRTGGAASSAAPGGAAGAPPRLYAPSSLALEERYELCRSVGEECIQEEELRALLKVKPNPVCYDGFEPSGRMHIAQGILKSILVNRLTAAGCIFKFYVADWFAL